ncbi:hypothetical protein UFOVP1374_41 [uncultured Caudovirales phage]|uniref:Uncharacterized protein n=1 Tax=uncultured Caudovirales phage TaxID=2100421 RepID=A0A6J5S3S3_9CAUD|nr:hypothetical protein UFOVP1374_41 [uncultured Caudovirales phage]
MIIPALPEAVHIRRNANGFTHSFSHLQMDAYGRECAKAALNEVADFLERGDLSAIKDDQELLVYAQHLIMGLAKHLRGRTL